MPLSWNVWFWFGLQLRLHFGCMCVCNECGSSEQPRVCVWCLNYGGFGDTAWDVKGPSHMRTKRSANTVIGAVVVVAGVCWDNARNSIDEERLWFRFGLIILLLFGCDWEGYRVNTYRRVGFSIHGIGILELYKLIVESKFYLFKKDLKKKKLKQLYIFIYLTIY